MCLIVESVFSDIRSGCIKRVVLLAIVWQMSWEVSILQLDERLVDESHHIVYSWPVSSEGLSRRSVVVVQIKANANKHRTHADTSNALSKMRGSGRAHDDGDE